jgi:acetyl-CoA carboxylase biotin carboxyl carrier protein
MTFNEIKELIEIFDESNVNKLSIKEGEFKIELDKNVSSNAAQVVSSPAPVQAAPAVVSAPSTPAVETSSTTATDANADYIASPMVGTFYEAPSPTSDAYVKVGDTVKAGQTVCIVEAMKIMNEIQAEFDCEIVEKLVEDGQAVEFDTPLFKVKRV